MELFIGNVAPVMLLQCSTNVQSFVLDRSSSISQFISGNLRNLQKFQSYLCGIMTSTFKTGTGGCGGCVGRGGWD